MIGYNRRMLEFARIDFAPRILAAGFILVGIVFGVATKRLAGGEVTVARPADVGTASGTVEGTVFYRNDRKHAWRLARYYVKSTKNGELAEAAIALTGPSLKQSTIKGKPAVITVDQKEMRFVPETVAIRAGTRVRFTNSDAQTHNISLDDPRLRFSNTIANGQEAVESFPRSSGIRRPFALGCKLHSQMQGWIYVFDHPFFQVTGVDGRFRLAKVPAGNYRLEIAQSAGDLHASRVVQIKPDETLKIEIVLTPEDRTAE